MKRRLIWLAKRIPILAIIGLALFAAINDKARHKAQDLWHQSMVLLNLEVKVLEGADYFCPMHPEIQRTQPGDCPICSMGLVPKDPVVASQEPGILKISDRQIQQAGVRIGEVLTRDLFREIDATGTVEFNHHRHATVSNRIPD